MSKRSEIMRRIAEQELAAAWPQWKITALLGRGAYGEVYEIRREEMGLSSSGALKIIRTDEETFKTSAVTDGTELANPYRTFFNHVAAEIHIMELLKGAPNIVIIDDYKVLRDNGECSVLIRMELLDNLASFIKKRGGELSLGSVLKIGIDICHALEYCEHCNIIHRDIKESNLFYNRELNTFKLGDFGVSRRMDSFGQKASMTGIGTISYMAPEVFGGESYDSTVDIYSLGIVLYTLLNGNRLPFTPLDKPELDAADVQKANNLRLNREELPSPAYADPALAKIICKACSPSARDRYQSARALRQSLIKYTNNLDKELLSATPQAAAVLLANSKEKGADPNDRNTSDTPASKKASANKASANRASDYSTSDNAVLDLDNLALNIERKAYEIADRISNLLSKISMPVRIISLAAIALILVFLLTRHAEKRPLAGGSFDLSQSTTEGNSLVDKDKTKPDPDSLVDKDKTKPDPDSLDNKDKTKPDPDSLVDKDKTKPDPDSLDDKDKTKPDPDSLVDKEDGEQKLTEYYTTSSNAVSETTDETKQEKEEKDPYKDLLDMKAYTCNMDLAGGMTMGRFVVVKNNSSDVLDLHADFQFLDKRGKAIAEDKYVDYAIAPGQKGIVLQQSNLKGVESINYKLTASKSSYLPITECIDWKVENLKQDGIIIHVLNPSVYDIHDFRVRVLWFDEKKKLETVAFRWNNNTDHIFRSGDSFDLDFQSPSGKETYSVFFHGTVDY